MGWPSGSRQWKDTTLVLLFFQSYFLYFLSLSFLPSWAKKLSFSQGDPGVDSFIQGPKGEKGRRGHQVSRSLVCLGPRAADASCCRRLGHQVGSTQKTREQTCRTPLSTETGTLHANPHLYPCLLGFLFVCLWILSYTALIIQVIYISGPWFPHLQNETIRLKDAWDLSSFKILQFYNLNNAQGFTLLACFLLLPVLIDVYQVPVILKDKTLV